MSKLEAISDWVDQGINNKTESKLNSIPEQNAGNKNYLNIRTWKAPPKFKNSLIFSFNSQIFFLN